MVRTSRALALGFVVVLLVGVLSFAGGVTAALSWGPSLPFVATIGGIDAPQRTAPAELQDEFRVFWETWNLIEQKFYRTEELDQQEMVYGAIEGLMRSLGDDYTVFERPADAEITRERMSGQFEGIGAYLEYREGQLLIVAPIENSPAERAGLLAGDQILAIDEQDVNMLLKGIADAEASREAARLIRGPRGTQVRLSVLRPSTGETLDLTIMREAIAMVSVRQRLLDDNIGYVQISEFQGATTSELDRALTDLLAQKPDGIVLDLRNNPGGLLTTAQEVLGRFVSNNVALYEEFGDGSRQTLNTIYNGSGSRVLDLPMVVLINKGSASASEIVAGALRDHGRAVLVGETTFGKGSVQSVERLSDGSSARITIAHWLTPDEDEIHLEGIDPDYYVPFLEEEQYRVTGPQRRPDDPETLNDSQLWWALHILASGERPTFPTPTPTATGELAAPEPTPTPTPQPQPTATPSR